MGVKQKLKLLLVKFIPSKIKLEVERRFKFMVNPNHEAAPYINISFSQEGEDLVLARFIGNKSNGFYVDIGAHHPHRFSNTYKFYLNGWSGINIDALPGSKVLFDLKRPNDINLEIDVLQNSDPVAVYHMFKESAFNSFDSAISEHRDQNTPDKIIEKRFINTAPLSGILKSNLPPKTRIDFFSIDVEGMDLDVLKSNDWALYRPTYICLESIGTSIQDDIESLITQFLNEHHYSLVAKTMNSVFYKNLVSTDV